MSKYFTQTGAPITAPHRLTEERRDSVRLLVQVPCSRCGGSGRYGHYGVCFGCSGSGHSTKAATAYTEAQLPKAMARASKTAERKAAAAKAKAQEEHDLAEAYTQQFGIRSILVAVQMAAARPQAATHHTQRRLEKAVRCADAFRSCARRGDEKNAAAWAGWLQESWTAYLNLAQQIREEDSVKAEIRENTPSEWVRPGRYEIAGTIAGTKIQESSFGATLKAIVKVGPRTYWVSVPSSCQLEPQELRGRAVSFVATIERSPKDPLFGFASRPSKWLVEEVEQEAAA